MSTQQLNDKYYKQLGDLGYNGALPDRWKKYLSTFGFQDSNVDDLLYKVLGLYGYTGSLNDRLKASIDATGGLLPLEALEILSTYGTDAHMYIPGIGYIQGKPAGNYLESTGITPATLDGVVGKVDDATGTIDATQATTANKPFLRKGAVNLLLRSQEFDVFAVWAAASGITANTQTAPDGTLTADTIDSAAATPYQAVACLASTQYTYSVYIKLGSLAAAGFKFAIRNDTGAAFIAQDIVPTQTPTADGWTRITYTFTTPVGCVTVRPYLYRNNTPQTGTFFAWGAMLNTGTLAEYAPTTSAPASNGVGNYAWGFDGSNDSLALDSVPFQIADDHCVVLGAYLRGSATLSCFGIADTTLTAPSLRIRFSAGAPEYYLRDNALTTVDIISDTAKVNQPCVITGRRVGVNAALRVNAEQKGSSTTVLGVGTFSMACIGARPFAGAVGEFWKGNIYPVIAIKGTVTDADLLILEKFVGSLSGVTI